VNDLGAKLAKIAFEERKADYLLAAREESGNVGPVFASKGEDVGNIQMDVPYQLVMVLTKLYPWVGMGKIAIVARRCDEKALNELTKRGIFDASRIVKIGLACSKEQIAKCRCSDPVPSKVDFGEPQKGVASDELADKLLKMTEEERLKFWVRQFRKCQKCFGCTNNCPVCFCDHNCVLEERELVAEKSIPPGLSFHLVRSFHLADKCVECGECERSCPADIPLLTLRKMVRKDMKELYNYSSGDEKAISPLLTTLEGDKMEGDDDVC